MYRRRLESSLAEVMARIEAAARRAGRDPAGVKVVVVTKGHGIEAAEAAVELGLRDLGENRVEQLEERAGRFAPGSVRWHMIGRLQRRKAPRVREVADLLHSLDSLRLAERLDGTAEEGARVLPVLLQVNTSGEESKGGFEPRSLKRAAERIGGLESLRIEGLMTMAPFTSDDRVLRSTFASLRTLQEELREEVPGYAGEQLSMGMSNDFEIAVEEGSTMVRLGTILLGEQPE